MANYTLELRQIVDHRSIFNFEYEFYDESKRAEFERNFIRHFYFREIGCDTVDRFILYLEDKMKTVFPYYNELFKAANIEYSVLDNYNMTENFKLKRENLQKGSGVSSTRGETHDSQTSESEEKRNSKNENTLNVTGSNNETENTQKSAENSGTETSNKNSSESINKEGLSIGNDSEIRRFLDTPQGKLDLTDAKYLTTLNQDNKTTELDSEEKTESTGSETVESSHSGTGSETGERTLNGSDTRKEVNNGSEETTGNTKGTFEGEQRIVHDNNTRSESHGEHTEEYLLTKRGNIGVDTDADMIQKHIKLQKIMRNIERMFFEECDDLFMLVY